MRVALIAAADRYEDDSIVNLDYAGHDLRKFSGFLEYAVGFDRVVVISQPNSSELLNTARNMVSELAAGDLFLFYFAGHGYTYHGEHLLLCPTAYLSRLEYFSDTVPVHLLKKETERPDVDRLLILDSCRSEPNRERGEGEGLRGESGLRNIAAGPPPRKGSLTLLCSCSEGERAAEIATRKQGLFTASLMDVLGHRHSHAMEARVDDNLVEDVSSTMQELALGAGIPSGQTPWRASSGSAPLLLPGSSEALKVPNRPPPSKSGARQMHRIQKNQESDSGVRVLRVPTLKVITEPSGATVILDGRKRGGAPIVLKRLAAGTYSLRVELPGYLAWDEDIAYAGKPGETLLEITLDSDPDCERYQNGRFVKHIRTSVITDTQTALQWLVGPDEDTTHYEAEDWVDGLGGSWRLPSADELKELYESGITTKDWGPFENSGWDVWTGELDPEDSSCARFVLFDDGVVYWYGRGSSYGYRVFAVRSRG